MPPKTSAISTEAKPIASEILAPAMMRANVSRPRLSVPIGCAQLGPSNVA